MPAATAIALSRSEQIRRRQLLVTKRRATALLAVVTMVFVLASVLGATSGWSGYLQASAAASMVGGLADWFAVTALFHHPLGLPIPHTAIVVERKDQFAATLGEFIQESFLTPDIIVERVRAANVVTSVGRWLADPSNAARIAAEMAAAIVAVTDLLDDDDAGRAIERFGRGAVDAVPLAPLAGHIVQLLVANGDFDVLLDKCLHGLNRYFEEHRGELRRQFRNRLPRWLPSVVDNRLFDRVLDGVSSVLLQMEGDRDHDLRRQLNARLEQLTVDLKSSPELRAHGERLKAEILARPELRHWLVALWFDAKAHLRAEAFDLTRISCGLSRPWLPRSGDDCRTMGCWRPGRRA